MVLEEFTYNKKKKTKSFALDEYLIKRLESLSANGEFGSQSNIVSIALYEFMTKHVDNAPVTSGNLDVQKAIADFLKSSEGKTLIKSIISESLSASSEKDKHLLYEQIEE